MAAKKEFILIVAGGRTFTDIALMDREIRRAISELPNDLVVSIMSGMQRTRFDDGTFGGADWLAYEWANQNGCKVYTRPADWKAFGNRAGFIRNKEMANDANGLLAFWDWESKGTEHMIQTARNFELDFVRVVPFGNAPAGTGIQDYINKFNGVFNVK